MHVVDMVFYWARATPHRAAIVQSEMVTTFQALADAIESICDRIDRLNLDCNMPVAVSITNPSFALSTAFSLARSGYSVAPVNAALYPHLAGAGIRNLIYDAEGQMTSGGRNIRFEMSWLPDPAATPRSYRHRPVGDASIIFFTSGTTGIPKAIALSKDAIATRYADPLSSCANGDHHSALIMPGIAGGYGFNRACEMLFAGKTACFAPTAEAALSLVDLFDIEVIVASPRQALALAEIKANTAHYSLSSLRLLRLGGSVITPEMACKFRGHLCRHIVLSYASTEAGLGATAPYDVMEAVPNAVGFIGPDVELQIVDEIGAALPAGLEGVVRLRTAQWRLNSRERNERGALNDNSWFYPGDIGILGDDGLLRITSRSNDVINSGGVKVSASKIEETLRSNPAIVDAAALGVTGSGGMEEIWVAVVLRQHIDNEEIKRLMVAHKNIGVEANEVFTIDAIPRGDLGKIQQYRLREQLRAMKKGS